MSEITIRPASVADLHHVQAIQTHYILNTLATLADEPRPYEAVLAQYEQIVASDLPYLVAVEATTQEIIGFANAHKFRGNFASYSRTVEISIYCHAERTGSGTGRKLLAALMEALKHTSIGVTQAISVMSIDPSGKRGGIGLQEFYERNGFTKAGQLEKVGFKFGQWVDIVYLQRAVGA